MTAHALDLQPLGGMPSGGLSGEAACAGGAAEGRSLVGVSTALAHAMFDTVLARLSGTAGVVVSSADIQEV